jgi:hypothetical protein
MVLYLGGIGFEGESGMLFYRKIIDVVALLGDLLS